MGFIPAPPEDGYVYPEAQKHTEATLRKELEAAQAETKKALGDIGSLRKELDTMTNTARNLEFENKKLRADFSSQLSVEKAAHAAVNVDRDAARSALQAEKEKYVTEKARADDLERRRVERPPNAHPRVKIYGILWGENFRNEPHVWDRAYSFAENKAGFQARDIGVGSENWTGCISYRYDDTGRIRHLLITNTRTRHFDGWNDS